jgi:orotidine-5'-phosphate decarboxylase
MLVMRNPILAALDVSAADHALALVSALSPVVGGFKIGKELFISVGPEIVRRIRAQGASVFLDLKLHDIPNTVARAVAAMVGLDVQMLTVHCSGGTAMMQAAEESAQAAAAKSGCQPPLVLGVTVLTSMDNRTLAEIGLNADVSRQVERLASLAVQSGLRGLVCSPLEIVSLRQSLPEAVQLVTPGIRGASDPADDQKRTLSARQAIEAGASWLVIGRPICAATNPRAAAEQILASLV